MLIQRIGLIPQQSIDIDLFTDKDFDAIRILDFLTRMHKVEIHGTNKKDYSVLLTISKLI